jgi:carboxypeptidase D
MQVPSVDLVHKNLNVFPFKSFPFILSLHIFDSHAAFVSQSFLAQINQIADKCNYNSYLKKYLTYPPPPAPFPLPGTSTEADPGCDVHDEIIGAALLLNPAFNIYRIFDMVYYLLLIYLSLR